MAVEVLQDFAYCGFLLIAGHILRSKIKLLQRLFIPTSLIGGVLGLLLSRQVLGRYCSFSLDFSANMPSLAMPLLAILFCTQLIGLKFDKSIVKSSLSLAFMHSGIMCLQNIVSGIIMLLLLAAGVSSASFGISTLPFFGFYGGHGLPAVAGNIFESFGYWSNDIATSVGTTFATVGLLYGVIFGVVIINIAARKGLISSDAGTKNISSEERSGYVPEEKRTAAIDTVTSNNALNPVAFQLAIILSMVFFAYKLMNIALFKTLGIAVCCLFVSIVYIIIGKVSGAGKYLDRKSLQNTSGAALEFLIVSSVAMTNLSVFSDYALEIVILSVAVIISTTWYVFFFGKRWYKENWAEKSLGTFGTATGVLATGFLLIRVADPYNKTGATENLALGNSYVSPTIQTFFLYLYPIILVKNHSAAMWLTAGGLILFTVAGCLLNLKKKA